MITAQLQTLSCYSLLQSTNKIEELVRTAKDYGYQAMALTDLNIMTGAVEFYKSCKKNGVKPIIGLTLDYHLSDEQPIKCRMLLYAKDQKGYENLMKISSAKMERDSNEPFYFSEFFELLNNIVIIEPEQGSQLSFYYQKQENEQLRAYLSKLTYHMQNEMFYAGVSLYPENTPQASWLSLLEANKIEPIALHDVRYLHPQDAFSVAVLKHLEAGTKITTEEIGESGSLYLSKPSDFTTVYTTHKLERAVINTDKVAGMCDFSMQFNQTLLPHYDVPDNKDASLFLRELCLESLPKRIDNPGQEYLERLDYELSVIEEMGFVDYFLIIWDVMMFAQREDILFGPGRGSAAGSLVSYLTYITHVDPIKYDLLFERFLNKDRYTMPDIDLDIPDRRRDEVLQYVNSRYGHHCVSQIATFGTLAAKMALRDISRVFGLNQNEIGQWSKAFPARGKHTLKEAYKESKTFRELAESSDKNRLIFEVASKVEGLPRHLSTHAAGVVISDQDLTQWVPLQEGSNTIPLTQFTMNDVEEIGLLKMDFLGLKNLTIIDDTMKNIAYTTGKKIDLLNIPLDDDATLKLFRKGQTTGIFQFDSQNIKNVLKKLGPTSLEDVAAVSALHRPGPMANIDIFIDRKKGKVPVTYIHESLKPILDVTYGVIVYQEQIMKIASVMAGFSLGEADILRRAIGKKKKEVLDEQRDHFIKGSLSQGYDVAVASEVYDYIERFANFGFNRSHAIAYGFVSYWMAYFKVHYTGEFFSALLHSDRQNTAKVKEYLLDATRMGLKLVSPDINKATFSFSFQKDVLVFGLSAIKGVRSDFAKSIIANRNNEGSFNSLKNFLMRMEEKWLKEDHILPLIYSGAFDKLHPNRKELVDELGALLKSISYSAGSLDLLDILSPKKEEHADYTVGEKLDLEADYLGMYISGHPVDDFKIVRLIKNVTTIDQLQEKMTRTIFIYVKNIKVIRAKTGEKMAFLEGNDGTGELSLTLFPVIYKQVSELLELDKVLVVTGKVERSSYTQSLQMLVNNVESADELAKKMGPKVCYIKIPADKYSQDIVEQLMTILKKYKGQCPIILFNEQSAQKNILNAELWVKESVELKNEVCYLLGKSTIIFQ
ncbi:DNA polymerase III subunit alpha [Vagococcus sp. PNs007]|uniref:DNA polymerase III subunit alpha n=1 Tax=Vagococcus proximus TaxID=2991417 RepID=A0ABT5WZB8_9ENTE|nr:DNA polymerase III subunit alpha [Vagococcus proximus]